MINKFIFMVVLFVLGSECRILEVIPKAETFSSGFTTIESDGLALHESTEIEYYAGEALKLYPNTENSLTEIAKYMHDELHKMPDIGENYCFASMTTFNAYFATRGKYIYMKADSSNLHIFCSNIEGNTNEALP